MGHVRTILNVGVRGARSAAKIVLCLSLLGCATADNAARPPRAQVGEAEARRLYTLGEQRFALGDAVSAVAIWRHGILALPKHHRYDELRHKLILRRAYGQLVAHHQSGDKAQLEDAQRMLLRYAAAHEALFGEGEDAKQERGAIYEILYEVEAHLEAPAKTPDANRAARLHAPTRSATEVAGGPVPVATGGPGPAANDQTQVFVPGSQTGDDRHRRIRVGRWAKLASIDDPKVMSRLRSVATDPFMPSVLTAPSFTMMLPPRPLVRMAGLARTVTDEGVRRSFGSTALVRTAVVAVRPQLRACYGAAFARTPLAATHATVEVQVGADGRLGSPRIVEGHVVDAGGDACVMEELAKATVTPDDSRGAVRVQIPLSFFYDGAVYLSEADMRPVRSVRELGFDNQPAWPNGGPGSNTVRQYRYGSTKRSRCPIGGCF